MKKTIAKFCIITIFSVMLLQQLPFLRAEQQDSLFARLATFANFTKTKLPHATPTKIIYTPTVMYNADKKTIQMAYVNENNKKMAESETWFFDVETYNFSPSKQYLFAQQLTPEESKYNLNAPKELIKFAEKATLIDPSSFTEIASFDGRIIMHEFSPDEKTLLIARINKGFGERTGLVTSNTKGILPGTTKPIVTGEFLRYELFDIASKTIIASFEHIRAITFDTEDVLIVKYENKEIEAVVVYRDKKLNPFKQLLNYIIPQSTIEVVVYSDKKLSPFRQLLNYIIPQSTLDIEIKNYMFDVEILYDSESKKLEVYIPLHKKKFIINDAIAYDISPLRKYIVIKLHPGANIIKDKLLRKNPVKSVLISTADSTLPNQEQTFNYKNTKSFGEFVTYEFQPDSNEAKMLALQMNPISYLTATARTLTPTALGWIIETFWGVFPARAIAAGTYGILQLQSDDESTARYELIDIELGALIKLFDSSTKTAYFASAQELVIIDKNDKSESWDPDEGITLKEKKEILEQEKTDKEWYGEGQGIFF